MDEGASLSVILALTWQALFVDRGFIGSERRLLLKSDEISLKDLPSIPHLRTG